MLSRCTYYLGVFSSKFSQASYALLGFFVFFIQFSAKSTLHTPMCTLVCLPVYTPITLLCIAVYTPIALLCIAVYTPITLVCLPVYTPIALACLPVYTPITLLYIAVYTSITLAYISISCLLYTSPSPRDS